MPKFCHQCAAQNVEDGLFCQNCGVSLTAASGAHLYPEQAPRKHFGIHLHKNVLIGIAVVVLVIAYVVQDFTSSRIIGTPVIPIGELKYNTKENCGKAATVKGEVLQYIGDEGYEIGQDGQTLRVLVPKSEGKARPLPAIGKNIEANVFMVCSSGNVLVTGVSFSELP
jgi:hypothetical protein